MIVALVPTNVATVTLALAACAVCLKVCLEEAAHATVVPDVQDAVLHKLSSDTVALGVKLYEPKLSPAIVTVPEPDPAVLLGTLLLYTGASNVKVLAARVPTTAPTVTFVYAAFTVVIALV
jgi:hypothetical protein